VKIVDFHNHYYPPAYLEALRSAKGPMTVTDDDQGNPVLHSPGDTNIAVRGHRDIQYRQEVLDREGVDMQVLTFTAPGVQIHPLPKAVLYARLVNDTLATITRARGDRFTALATLPLNDPDASVAELERAMGELGFPGAMVFGNVDGVPLSDERYTLAAAGLVFSGVVEHFPRIKWVLAHLGGAIPYLAERLDRGYSAFRECRANIDKPPSEYLKDFYYDTVNFDPNALQLAIDFAGTSHLLAGSDYPHQIGSLQSMLESIRGLRVPDDAKEQILGGNAARLLNL
jgi:aminocarboxymuconate-semialdehyde decarboxylase